MVAGDNIALLIHTQAAVGVTIKGKTNVQALLHDKLLQALNMRRAGISVDVRAIRLIVDDVGISPQSIEHGLCNVPRTAVCAVQTNLDALKRVDAQRNQVAHIAITARHIVHGAADMLTMGKRQQSNISQKAEVSTKRLLRLFFFPGIFTRTQSGTMLCLSAETEAVRRDTPM